MAPLRDAVRLVDDDERWPRSAHLIEYLVVRQLLGCQEQVLELTFGEVFDGLAFVTLRDVRVDARSLAGNAFLDRLDTVALQRDQRRDHNRCAGLDVAGDLVDGRLARAGRHDNGRVAPREV